MYLRTLGIAAAALASVAALSPAGAVAVPVTQIGNFYSFNATYTTSPLTATDPLTVTFAGLTGGQSVNLNFSATDFGGQFTNAMATFNGTPLTLLLQNASSTGTTMNSSGFTGQFTGLFDPTKANTLIISGLSSAGFSFNGSLAASAAAVVPELSTWMMMTLGFGALGYSLRRRRPAVSFA